MATGSMLRGFATVAASVRRKAGPWAALAFSFGLGLIAAGCSKASATAPPPPPPLVEVVRVEQKDVPLYSDWIGTLDGMVNAEIKAQVSGYLLAMNYTEGSLVHKGQLMFAIDPRPFEAALEQARGNLAQAEGQLAQANSQLAQAQAQVGQAQANQGKTQMDVNRYAPLAKGGAITKQDYDTAQQANLANQAQLKAQEAGVETARAAIAAAKSAAEAASALVKTAELNLSFTKIVSPIDGVAGIAQAQVGNLVGPTTGDLTTVSTVDPIRAYFTLSEQEYLGQSRRARSRAEAGAADEHVELQLVLSDGTTYEHKGKLYAQDRQVDVRTGAIRVAGVFPNPGNALRPGQYGRVRSATSVKSGALLVPQRAVTEMQGSFQVAVVGAENKVEIRTVEVGPRVDSMWIIETGLQPGETVIAEGTQKVRPGLVVAPRPFDLASARAPR